MTKLLHDDTTSALEYVYKHSWRARVFKRQSAKLVDDALWEIASMPPKYRRYTQRSNMESYIKHKIAVGNPIIAALILQILVGIIAKLVVDWWWNNRRSL